MQAEAEESLFLQLAAALLCRVPASAELQIRPPPAAGVTEAVKPVNWSLAVQGVKVGPHFKAGLIIQLVPFYESKSV